ASRIGTEGFEIVEEEAGRHGKSCGRLAGSAGHGDGIVSYPADGPQGAVVEEEARRHGRIVGGVGMRRHPCTAACGASRGGEMRRTASRAPSASGKNRHSRTAGIQRPPVRATS